MRLFASRSLVALNMAEFVQRAKYPLHAKPRCINKLSPIDIIVVVTITMVALMLHSLQIIILFDGISIVISLN